MSKEFVGVDAHIDPHTALPLVFITADTIRGTVSGNIAESTEDWVGGDTELGNLYALAYEMGMDLADELVATKGLGRIGVPGGAYMYQLSKGHKGYMDSMEQGRAEIEAAMDSVWGMAANELYSQLGYATVEAMTPDKRSEEIWKKAVDIAMELAF